MKFLAASVLPLANLLPSSCEAMKIHWPDQALKAVYTGDIVPAPLTDTGDEGVHSLVGEYAPQGRGQRMMTGKNDTDKDAEVKAVTQRCFEECVEKGLNAHECEKYIKSVLGDDLSGHEIPDLHLKISNPRNSKILADTYFMVGIPANLHGETNCNLNDGVIRYKFAWETDEGDKDIPDVDCFGLSAVACCDKFMATLDEEGIPKMDKKGNCLSCWVHQENLEPVLDYEGQVSYIDYSAGEDAKCVSSTLGKTEVEEADLIATTALKELSEQIYAIIDDGASTCEKLTLLQNELLIAARSKPKAMKKISSLLCPYCPGHEVEEYLPDELSSHLSYIAKEITKEPVKSDNNKIVIYTDHQGKVLEPPKVGGNRAGLDWDRDDPECREETDAYSPASSASGDGADEKSEEESASKPPSAGMPPPSAGSDLCIPPQVYNHEDKICECPGELIAVSPQDGYCGCLGMLEPYLDPVDYTYTCECPGDTFPVEGFQYTCQCPGDLVLACDCHDEGRCQCPGMTQKTGPNGDQCLCPGVKELLPNSGGICLCPATTVESKDMPGACDCEDEYQFQKADGTFCFNCVAPEFPNFRDGTCFDCPKPKIANEADGSCLCPPTTQEDGKGGCKCTDEFEFMKSDGSLCFNCDATKDEYPFFSAGTCFKCPAPKIPSSYTGVCLCPSTYVEEGDTCVCAPEFEFEKTDGTRCFNCPGKDSFPDEDEGTCFTPNCEHPQDPNEEGICECPASMTAIVTGQNEDGDDLLECVCNETENKYINTSGDACYTCPESQTSDGANGCKCKPGLPFITHDGEKCFTCKASEFPDLKKGICFTCPFPKIANVSEGTCECPPTTIPDGAGSCKCEDEKGLFLKADKSLCFRCDDPAMPFPNLSAGVCFDCPEPKLPEFKNGYCACPGNTIDNFDPKSDELCVCPPGEFKKADGLLCFKCNSDKEFPNFTTGECFLCPAPKEANTSTGECTCPNNTIPVGDVCKCPPEVPFLTLDGTKCFSCPTVNDYPNYRTGTCFPCPKPKLADTDKGTCTCPPTTIPDGDSCGCEKNMGLFLKADKSKCFTCPPGQFPNLSTGKCFECERPKIPGFDNGSCTCPPTTVVAKEGEGIGGCKCAAGYDNQQADGSRCFNCPAETCILLNVGICADIQCDAPKRPSAPFFCDCSCPEGMVEDANMNCGCDSEKGLFLTKDGDDCHFCPETLTSDGNDECECLPEFEFMKTDGSRCFNCPDDAVPKFATGSCFKCPYPKEPDEENIGQCKCPETTIPVGNSCGCEDGLFLKSDKSLCFSCQEGEYPNLLEGTCFVCEFPKIANINNGKCECPPTKKLDEKTGKCVCADGFEFEKDDGSLCFSCPGDNSFPNKVKGDCFSPDCKGVQFPDKNGRCVCPAGMKKNGGECNCDFEDKNLFINGAGNECYECPSNLVGDGKDGCECPDEFKYLKKDGSECFNCEEDKAPDFTTGTCFTCPKPKKVDSENGNCICPPGTIATTMFANGCGCEEGLFRKADGSMCFTCPEGQFPDLSTGKCFECPAPKIANTANGSCICPTTTVDDGKGGCKCDKKYSFLKADGSKCFNCPPHTCPDLVAGICFATACDFPEYQNDICECTCPVSMERSKDTKLCSCDAEKNLYITSSGDECYSCPPTLEGDGMDGCTCKAEFQYKQADGKKCFNCSDKESPNFKDGVCFSCPYPQIPNEANGTCKCPKTTKKSEDDPDVCVCEEDFEFQKLDRSFCFNCPENQFPNLNAGTCFQCDAPKLANEENGSCTCPLTTEDNGLGGCRCEASYQYKKSDSSLCFNCKPGEFPNYEKATCFECAHPKLADTYAGSCVCPKTTIPVGDTCGCEKGLFRKADGTLCFECEKGEFANLKDGKCFECPAPKLANTATGTCTCPRTTKDDGKGGCACLPEFEFAKDDGSICFNCPDYTKANTKEGTCFTPKCEFPETLDEDGECQCPVSMYRNEDGKCDCDNDSRLFINKAGDGCYTCPETKMPDGNNGCVCEEKFEFEKADETLCFNCEGDLFPNLDKGTCFSCPYPKIAVPEDGTCSCPETTVDNGKGGCKCAPGFEYLKDDESFCFNCIGSEYPNLKLGECFECTYPKIANTANGECTCPLTTKDDGKDGCDCADGFAFKKMDCSFCFNCKDGESPNYRDGVCFKCDAPKIPNTSNGQCLCPETTTEGDDGMCVCEDDYEFQTTDMSRCFNCVDGQFPNFSSGECFDCPAPKIADSLQGTCTCPVTTVDDGKDGCKCADGFEFQVLDKSFCFNCKGHELPNLSTGECFVCPAPKIANIVKGSCTCPATTKDDGKGGCDCADGYEFQTADKSRCFNCNEGEFPDFSKGTCFSCPFPKIPNSDDGTCLCPATTKPALKGEGCVCEAGFKYQKLDGSVCFNCDDGQFPNLIDGECFDCAAPRIPRTDGSCDCPPTTVDKNGSCECAPGYESMKDDGAYCFTCRRPSFPDTKLGKCFVVDCDFPKVLDEKSPKCNCPESMEEDDTGACVCDETMNLYITASGDGCYSCPDTLKSDGMDGCICKDEFEFLKSDKSECFNCDSGKLPDLESGDCSCPLHLVEGKNGDCVCPGETLLVGYACVCPDGQIMSPGGKGECECPAELVENDDGECVCPSPLVPDETTNECVCPGDTVATDVYGECQCPEGNLFLEDAIKGVCTPCVNGFVKEDQSGCDTCPEPKVANMNLGKCLCPYPLMEDPSTKECVCPGSTVPTGEDGACECPDNNTYLASLATGKCVECKNGFVKDDQSGCDFCPYPKEADLDVGECVCPFPLVENASGGCSCPGDTYPFGPGGACQCQKCQYLADAEKGICKPCVNGFAKPDQTGCEYCEAPKVADHLTRSCLCPHPLVDDGNDGCKCPGMTQMSEGMFCQCPPNMKQNFNAGVGVCECKDGFEPNPNGEGCYQCPNNMIGDGLGGCTCEDGLFMSREKDVCFRQCAENLFLSSDDDGLTFYCSDDPANACPSNAFYKDGFCVGCDCGFCAADDDSACCQVDEAGSKCTAVGANEGKKGCVFNKEKLPFYPGYIDQSGSVCDSIDVKDEVPTSCSCVPSFSVPCAFPQDEQGCSVCNVEDLSEEVEECDDCKMCLKELCFYSWDTGCQDLVAGRKTGSPDQWVGCLSTGVFGGGDRKGLRSLVANEAASQCALGCTERCKKYTQKHTPDPIEEYECLAKDLASMSGDREDPCFNCRKCIFYQCHWQGECWSIARGETVSTGDDWASCLYTDGKLNRGRKLTCDDKSSSSNGWCDCAQNCKAECKKPVATQPDPAPVAPKKDSMCSAESMAKESQSGGDTCYNCRKCVFQNCPWSGDCWKIARGEWVASPMEWAKCLYNDGKMHRGRHLLATDGNGEDFDKWSSCAHGCEHACKRDGNMEPEPTEEDNSICDAEDMANKSSENQKCYDCRKCIFDSCRWQGDCHYIARGERLATPELWAQCLFTDGVSSAVPGSDAPSGEARKLFNYPYYGKYNGWCSCAQKCKAQCNKE